jgi:hypothetical protein
MLYSIRLFAEGTVLHYTVFAMVIYTQTSNVLLVV